MSLATRFESAQGRLAGVREELTEIAQDAGSISQDLRGLAQAEARLALAEMRENGGHAARSAAFGALALTFANLTLVFLALALMFGLGEALPLWAAALITAVVLGVVAAIGGLGARAYARRISPAPKRAIASIREDIQWAKSQLTLNRR